MSISRFITGRNEFDGDTQSVHVKDGVSYPYVTLSSLGADDDNNSVPLLVQYQDEAERAYQVELDKYLSSHPGDVYWRQRPELVARCGSYCVVSRLAVIPSTTKDRILGWRGRKGPQASNKSGFRATGHRVLLLIDEVEKKTESGIVLVDKTVQAERDRAVVATVIEIGHDAWSDKSTDYCDVGDKVLIGMYVGKFHESPIDGKVYRFVSDLDIISPIESAE